MKNKLSGFSFIELVLGTFVISILSLAILNSVFGLNILSRKINLMNDLLTKENYGLNYIVNEIDQSEYILSVPVSNITADKWIGFTLCKVNESSVEERYTLITYTLKNGEIYRNSFKTAKVPNRLSMNYFNGANMLLEGIEGFSGTFYEENLLIDIQLNLKSGDEINLSHHFKGAIYED